MTEITSEDIKEAIGKKLLSVAPSVAVYKESISNPKYPHFFIHQINLSDEEERKDYHILTYNIDIRYRTVSDPSTDLNLEQNLDNMGFRLLRNFNIINLNDEKIKCEEKTIEKPDGVLHFFTTIKVLTKLIDLDENHVKQQKLTLRMERKNDKKI